MFALTGISGTPYSLALQRWPGKGPLLVYLHGLGLAGSTDWPRVQPSPALAGRASLAVDLLGFGKSPRPEGFGYALEDHAAVLAALLRAEPAVALIGHSLGGALAILVAQRLEAEGRVPAALILAEPNLRPEDATLSARVAATPLEKFKAQWPRWVAASDMAYYRTGMEQADPVAFHRAATSLIALGPTTLARFTALKAPRKGYILGGKSDARTQETSRLAAQAGARVETVPGAGHAFCEEDPAGFAEAIAALLPPG